MNEDQFSREDKLLIEACLEGDSFAQEKLFKKFYALMYTICLRYAGNEDDAKDILQEGYIKVFNNLSRFKFEGSLKGWIKRIMVNTAIDKYRKAVSEPPKVDITKSNYVAEKEDVLSQLNKKDLMECVKKLPIGYRTVFNMYVIEGYSHKDIARELGISEGTSKSQLFKAKQLLQTMIANLFR